MPETIREKGIGLAASLAEQETMAQRAIPFRSSEKEKQRFTRSASRSVKELLSARRDLIDCPSSLVL